MHPLRTLTRKIFNYTEHKLWKDLEKVVRKTSPRTEDLATGKAHEAVGGGGYEARGLMEICRTVGGFMLTRHKYPE